MIGQTIHNYNIIDKIGEGGMGVVYLGKDDMLDRKVAIKMLHARLLNDADLLERFKTEAQILSRMNHTNIASLYNFLMVEDSYCMVMEYIDGIALDDLLKSYGSLQVPYAANIISQTLEGLRFAHKKGVIHRDLKLSNLILSDDGTIKIMDFGIARAVGSSRLTSTGRAIGTLEYMSPEQIQGKEGDERSDIYATGIALYELLSGEVPFRANTEFELMKAQLEKKPESIRKKIPNISPELDKVILKALEKKPEKRFATAKAFQDALRKAVPDMIHASEKMAFLLSPKTQVMTPPTELMGAYQATTLSPAQSSVTPSGRFDPVAILKDENIAKKVFFGVAALALLLLLVFAGSRIFSGEKDKPDLELTSEIQTTIERPHADRTGISQPPTAEIPGEVGSIPNPPSGDKPSFSKPQETPAKKEPPQQKQPEASRPDPTPPPPKETNRQSQVTESSQKETKAKPSSSSFTGIVKIPSNTSVTLKLMQRLSSNNRSIDGKFVEMVAARSVKIDGVTIIKEGAYVRVKVVDVGKKLKPPSLKRSPVIGIYVYGVESAAPNSKMIGIYDGRREQIADDADESVYEKGMTFTFELEREKLEF